ncbi:glycoside hydrolase family 130 protein [uncultured Eudoraea sp.]|uniref:glycoside hydrolase family 130 protein n=1 Tax=uncultured Eudoraea sp. TaxID=1035614 RepID=UPI00261A00DA|nr:glycoside hydrolase family 130 protein [uncultured Eudoraea sp.]
MIAFNRSKTVLKADPKRVILLFNSLGIGTYTTKNRAEDLVQRVLKLTDAEIEIMYRDLLREFNHRHKDLSSAFLKFYGHIVDLVPTDLQLSKEKKLLLGAHFAKEYSIQSAALFNPSIVPHPNQENLGEGEKRFIISLRSVGEGHISSIEFREGIISIDGEVTLDKITPFATHSDKDLSIGYNKDQLKLRAATISNFDTSIFEALPSDFTYPDYKAALEAKVFSEYDTDAQKFLFDFIDTNYNLVADTESPLSERVIFPSAKGESMGMEDVRFVEFKHENGQKEFIGTYTAYDGHKITPQLILTEDFIHFKIRTMYGKAVSDKGFALFPEKINGKFVMTARQGGEDLTIMESDDLYYWNEFKVIMTPQFTWGLVQQGNCGSPLKTEQGWLLLTHAVGPLRKYVISAVLLDLEQPEKIIGKLNFPLISPNEEEREGYVPNVVYSCGAMMHNDHLVIPYAMSDSASSFATVSVSEILKNMKA